MGRTVIVLTITPLRYEGVKRDRKKKERRGLKKKERAKSRYLITIYRPSTGEGMGDGVFSPKLYGRVLI
jgi:hypothetical protein